MDSGSREQEVTPRLWREGTIYSFSKVLIKILCLILNRRRIARDKYTLIKKLGENDENKDYNNSAQLDSREAAAVAPSVLSP